MTDKDSNDYEWTLQAEADALVSWVDEESTPHEIHAILEWLKDHDYLNAVGQAFSTVFWEEYLEGSE